MPLVLFEEIEEPLKGLVGYLNLIAVKFLDVMLQKKTAVQIWDIAKEVTDLGGAFSGLLGKTGEEERAEDVLVIPVFGGLFALLQFGHQVLVIAVEKALSLDEVDEHEAVQHDRCVPPLEFVIRYAGDERQERVMLGLEAVIEAFGDLLSVEGVPEPDDDSENREALFVIEGERDVREFLNEGLAGLPDMIGMAAVCLRLSGSLVDPRPILLGLLRIPEDYEMFVGMPFDFAMYFASRLNLIYHLHFRHPYPFFVAWPEYLPFRQDLPCHQDLPFRQELLELVTGLQLPLDEYE